MAFRKLVVSFFFYLTKATVWVYV